MSKSVYSLVLSDDVVAAVDREAYRQGLSRSALINRLLAGAVACTTPEERMRRIFSRAESLLTVDGVFQSLLQSSGSMMSLRSALAYKYNPTVRYSVELDPGVPGRGQLRVSLRSQNSALLLCLGQFFRLWAQLEQAYTGRADCAFADGRYIRDITLPQGLNDQEQGTVLAAYLGAMERAMGAFFAELDRPAAAAAGVERALSAYLAQYPSV